MINSHCKLYIFSLFLLQCRAWLHQDSPLTIANPLQLIQNQALNTQSVTSKEVFEIGNVAEKLFLFQKDLLVCINNTTCAKSVAQLSNDLTNGLYYSYQVLDSWGKPESGIMGGNRAWLGRYQECNGISNTSIDPTFQGKYCKVYIGYPPEFNSLGLSSSFGITLGGCFPDTCDEADINSFLSPYLPPKMIAYSNCQMSDHTWNAKEIGAVILCVVLGLSVVASTCYDYATSREVSARTGDDDRTALFASAETLNQQPTTPGKFHQVCVSFSLLRNMKLLLSTEQKPGQINCLHGMRFFSMAWVILGHTCLFGIGYINNPVYIAKYTLEHAAFQAVINATFSVDSFFFLSGLLVSYLGLRELDKRRKLNVLQMYLLRYLRLTPAYAFGIFFVVSLWKFFGSGPYWVDITNGLSQLCTKYWWTNLLYINNMYPSDLHGECYAWGWYLANDMQFYLLSPLFLILLYGWPKAGMATLCSLLVASITITGAFSSVTSAQPQTVGGGYYAYQLVHPLVGNTAGRNGTWLDDTQQYSIFVSDLYTKPWCRIGAYIVGFMTGYALVSRKNKIVLSKPVVCAGWVTAAGSGLSIVYGLYSSVRRGELLDVNTAAFYNAVTRPVWCAALAWVVIACVGGYAGPIDRLLSWRAFMPLSRLTYCTYLLHPLVLYLIYASVETSTHISVFLIAIYFIGALVLTTLAATVMAMLVEFPASALTKALAGTGRSQRRTEVEHLSADHVKNEAEA